MVLEWVWGVVPLILVMIPVLPGTFPASTPPRSPLTEHWGVDVGVAAVVRLLVVRVTRWEVWMWWSEGGTRSDLVGRGPVVWARTSLTEGGSEIWRGSS